MDHLPGDSGVASSRSSTPAKAALSLSGVVRSTSSGSRSPRRPRIAAVYSRACSGAFDKEFVKTDIPRILRQSHARAIDATIGKPTNAMCPTEERRRHAAVDRLRPDHRARDTLE